MRKKLQQIERPALFYFAFLLFILSIVFVFLGIIKNTKNNPDETSISKVENDEQTEQTDLSEYIDDVNLSAGKEGVDEYYLDTDPFKETCEDTAGDEKVAISFGTVCYR